MSDAIHFLTDTDGRPLCWGAADDVFAYNCPEHFAARVKYYRDATRVAIGGFVCKPSLRLAVSIVRGFDAGLGAIPVAVELKDCRTLDGKELRIA